MPPVRLVALAPLALLAACNGSGDKGPERKTAAGEVLGGSISDSMLPLDTVQSQSPPLRDTIRCQQIRQARTLFCNRPVLLAGPACRHHASGTAG